MGQAIISSQLESHPSTSALSVTPPAAAKISSLRFGYFENLLRRFTGKFSLSRTRALSQPVVASEAVDGWGTAKNVREALASLRGRRAGACNFDKIRFASGKTYRNYSLFIIHYSLFISPPEAFKFHRKTLVPDTSCARRAGARRGLRPPRRRRIFPPRPRNSRRRNRTRQSSPPRRGRG